MTNIGMAKHCTPLRLALLCLVLGTLVTACTDEPAAGVTNPTPPTTTLPPPPPPSPKPTPTPLPESDVIVEVSRFPKESACKRGVGPTGTDDLRVGCSIEIRVVLKSLDGTPAPIRRTGNDLTWRIPKGRALVTLPWDENPWKRWLTGVAPGHFRIEVTLTMRNGDLAVGVLEGEVVP